MKTFLRLVLMGSFICVLSACDSFGTDNSPAPSALPTFTPAATLTSVWSDKVGNGENPDTKLSVAYDGDRLFTSDQNGLIIATDAKTDKRIWRNYLHMGATSGIALQGNKLVVGTTDAKIIALNTRDGSIIWQQTISNQVLAKPTISNGLVLVRTIDDEVFALDANTGKQRWVYVGNAPDLVLRAGASPMVVEDKVVAGLADGRVVVLSLDQGDLLWQQSVSTATGATDIERMRDVDVTPLVAGHSFYIASYQGSIVALNADTGDLLWHHDLSAYTGMVQDSHNLYITDADSNLWAFSKATGQVIWKQDKLKYRGLTAPVMMGSKLIVADKLGYVHIIASNSGQFIARAQVSNNGFLDAPIVAGNVIYLLDKNNVLQAYQIS